MQETEKTEGLFELGSDGDVNSLEDRLWACANLVSLEEHCFSSWLRTGEDCWLEEMEDCRSARQALMAGVLGPGARELDAEIWCSVKHGLACAMRLWETGNRLSGEEAAFFYGLAKQRVAAVLALTGKARASAGGGTEPVEAARQPAQRRRRGGDEKRSFRAAAGEILKKLKCCL